MHREEDEESLRVTHWPVLLFLAGLTTIPTELITPWTDQDNTDSESSDNSSTESSTSGIIARMSNYCVLQCDSSCNSDQCIDE